MEVEFDGLFREGDAKWLTLRQIANVLDKHISTVARWALKGVRGNRLPSRFIGGRRHVHIDDVIKFLNAINGGVERLVTTPAANEEERRQRVNDELVAKGF